MKKVLHLLASGQVGGIENLMYNHSSLSIHKNIYVFVWEGGYYTNKLYNDDQKIYSLKEIKTNYEKIKKVIEIIKKEQVNIVVSHNSSPLFKIIITIVHFFCKSVKTICYAHANAEDICEKRKSKGYAIRKTIHKTGFSSCDAIIAISESVKKSLMDMFDVSSEKINVIYNGIPLQKFKCERKDSSEKLRFIYVGRLIEEKGIQKTIRALKLLPRDIDYDFIIVGDGPYKKELMSLIKNSCIVNKIHLLGAQTDVVKCLSTADIFIHVPKWEEGFGISIIEAMGNGLLCICNNKGAIPEIIQNKINGLIVDDTSDMVLSEELQKAIKFLDDDECVHLLETAKESVERFTIENYTMMFDGMIEKICKDRKGKV